MHSNRDNSPQPSYEDPFDTPVQERVAKYGSLRSPAKHVILHFSEECSDSFVLSFLSNPLNFRGISPEAKICITPPKDINSPKTIELWRETLDISLLKLSTIKVPRHIKNFPREVYLTPTQVFPEFLHNQLEHHFLNNKPKKNFPPLPLRETPRCHSPNIPSPCSSSYNKSLQSHSGDFSFPPNQTLQKPLDTTIADFLHETTRQGKNLKKLIKTKKTAKVLLEDSVLSSPAPVPYSPQSLVKEATPPPSVISSLSSSILSPASNITAVQNFSKSLASRFSTSSETDINAAFNSVQVQTDFNNNDSLLPPTKHSTETQTKIICRDFGSQTENSLPISVKTQTDLKKRNRAVQTISSSTTTASQTDNEAPNYTKLITSSQQNLLITESDIEDHSVEAIPQVHQEKATSDSQLSKEQKELNKLQQQIMKKLNELQNHIAAIKPNQHDQHQPLSFTKPSTSTTLISYPKNSTLVIWPKKDTTVSQLKSLIQSKECPDNIILSNLKLKPDRLELRTASSSQADILKGFLSQEFPDNRLEYKRQKCTRLIFYNFSQHSEEKILETLQQLGFSSDEIIHIKTIHSKKEGHFHRVVNLPSYKASMLLLSNYDPGRPNYIQVGFKRLYFKLYARLIRCLSCQMLGDHPTHLCPNAIFCSRCGQNHQDKNCQNQPYCINCDHYNYQFSLSQPQNGKINLRNPYHSASDSTCPTYIYGLHNITNHYPIHLLDSCA